MPQRVWKCSVEKSFVPDLAARYRVSNIRSEKNLAEMRVLSAEMPVPGAVETEPVLEDVFLYYFGEKAGDEDALI